MLEETRVGPKKLSLLAQLLLLGFGVVLMPALSSVFPDSLARTSCPANSFYTRVTNLDPSFVPAVYLALCFPILLALLWSRVDLSRYSGAISPPEPRRRYFIPAICLLACGSALSVYLYVRSTPYYYCLTPNQIVVRNGYLDANHRYSWDAVREVHGRCWTSTPKRGAPFLGGSVDLLLDGGTELSVNLLGDHGAVAAYYPMVKKALRGKTYNYYVNKTVVPAACPSSLYPLLWYWPSGDVERPL